MANKHISFCTKALVASAAPLGDSGAGPNHRIDASGQGNGSAERVP
jgi:hypothetical protein